MEKQKWEYAVVRWYGISTSVTRHVLYSTEGTQGFEVPTDPLKLLSKMGEAGWEMIGPPTADLFQEKASGGAPVATYIYFKRPKA